MLRHSAMAARPRHRARPPPTRRRPSPRLLLRRRTSNHTVVSAGWRPSCSWCWPLALLWPSLFPSRAQRSACRALPLWLVTLLGSAWERVASPSAGTLVDSRCRRAQSRRPAAAAPTAPHPAATAAFPPVTSAFEPPRAIRPSSRGCRRLPYRRRRQQCWPPNGRLAYSRRCFRLSARRAPPPPPPRPALSRARLAFCYPFHWQPFAVPSDFSLVVFPFGFPLPITHRSGSAWVSLMPKPP